MNIFYNIEDVKKNDNSFLAVGTFDGVHSGHQFILEKVISSAKKNNGRSLLVTFEPHPRNVIGTDKLKLLTVKNEKIKLLKSLGLENLLILNFTKEFSQQTGKEFFVHYILEKIGLKEIFIGYDHRFGKGREGNEEMLRDLSEKHLFNINHIDARKIENEIISSTKIRNFILEGDIISANKFLGYNYLLTGKVIEGDKRGRTIDFPTANIEVDFSLKILPPNGVYAVEVSFDNKKLFGVMNLGVRPTIGNSTKVTPEVFIFDFNGDIYGKELNINFIERIRDEKKFNSLDELKNQINYDIKKTKEILIN